MKKLLRSACLLLMAALALQAFAYRVTLTELPAPSDVAVNVAKMAHQPKMVGKAVSYDNQIVIDNVTYGIDMTKGMAVVLGLTDLTIKDLVLANEVTYEGVAYPVKEIANSAFRENGTIETVQLPNQLETVGAYSFLMCSKLKSIALPDACQFVDTCAFQQCVSMTSIDLNQVKKLSVQTFWGDSALTSFTFPETLDSIPSHQLTNCVSLTNVEFKNNHLRTLAGNIFMNCTSLTEVKFPETIDDMGTAICWTCSKLSNVELPTNVTMLPAQTFVSCSSLKNVTLPDSFTAIDGSAFFGSGLEYVNIENIVEFGGMCFVNCPLTGMPNIVLNENCTVIPTSVFRKTGIKTFTASPNLVTLGSEVFYECADLNRVTLNEGLEEIGHLEFVRCPNITYVTIPSTVTVVNGYAFWGTGLQTLVCKAITPPENVTEADYVMDYSVPTLYVPEESIEAYKAAPYWQKFTNIKPLSEAPEEPRIEEITIDGILYRVDLNNGTAILINGAAASGDFVVPNTITYNRDVVCTVIGIGDGAFDENTNLTSITLNEDLETIGDDAFQYSSIPALHLPAKVQSVGHDFHYKATSLAEITVDESNPYLCAENSLLMSKDKKVVWGFPVANPATELILPDEVEIVKSDACNRCKNLTKIVINDNCKTIEREGFDNCTNCTELVLGKGIEFIGYQAFRNYNQMTSLTLPENLKEIDAWAFSWCQSMKEINFNNKLEKIGNGSFYHNDALEVVDLPASVTYINAYAFNTCDAITEFRCRATVPPQVITDLWEPQDHYINIPLLVPAGCEEAYANAPVWQKFSVIEALPTTGIDAVETAADATVVGIYTIDGKRLSEMRSGVNIVRMSDGTSRKVIK